jgi:hypothetical protein
MARPYVAAQKRRNQGRIKALGADAPTRNQGETFQAFSKRVLMARRAQKAGHIGNRAYRQYMKNRSMPPKRTGPPAHNPTIIRDDPIHLTDPYLNRGKKKRPFDFNSD